MNTFDQSPDRIFRTAVLNGDPVPEKARVFLEARGIDTAALEARLRLHLEFRG